MKTKEIIRIINENKNISDYEITVIEKKSKELFYVLKNLEINRAVDVTKVKINVYVDKNDQRGCSMVIVNSSDDEKSLKRKINNAAKTAFNALNPYYPVAEKSENIKVKTDFKEDLNEVALKIGEAVFKADIYTEGWINSTEIFVSLFKKSFINSKGVHHEIESVKCEVEVIPTWSNGKGEFELYKFFDTGKPDYKLVTEEVDEILNDAKNRSKAIKIADIKLPENLKVLIHGDMRSLLMWNFADELSYRSKFYKYNHYELNDTVSDIPFCITLKGNVRECSQSCPIDGNGVVLKDRIIIEDGKVLQPWGDLKHAYYLKHKATGVYPVLDLKGTELDYTKDKHLIICSFSSPQLDENSGYWGGEVRLGMYFDGKKYIPVTGFSIAGNIYEDIRKMHVSSKKGSYKNYTGPEYLIFEGINIF